MLYYKMLYKCERCNKEFNQKSNYNYHVNRKYPCKDTNQIVDTTIMPKK